MPRSDAVQAAWWCTAVGYRGYDLRWTPGPGPRRLLVSADFDPTDWRRVGAISSTEERPPRFWTRLLRSPGGHVVPGRVACQIGLRRAVGIHDVDFEVVVAAGYKGDLTAIRRPQGVRIP